MAKATKPAKLVKRTITVEEFVDQEHEPLPPDDEIEEEDELADDDDESEAAAPVRRRK